MIQAALLLAASAPDPVVGTFEGTSTCQVASSPCRDEHVLYKFAPQQPRHYRIDAYKLVSGQQIFMGPINVSFDPRSGKFDGPVVGGGRALGRLELTLKASHLSGRMTLADGSLYRLIEADKH